MYAGQSRKCSFVTVQLDRKCAHSCECTPGVSLLLLVKSRYLRNTYGRIVATPPHGATDPRGFRTFASLVRRCLVTTPTRFLEPHSTSHYWSDYSFHNEVVDMFLATLPRTQHGAAYDSMLRMMPANVELAQL